MRTRVVVFLLFAVAASLTLSLTFAQDRLATPPAPPSPPAPAAAPAPASPRPLAPVRDFSTLGKLQEPMLYACRRGAQWLYHMNGVKGRFLAGYVPPLQREMEGDHFLRQAGAAFAL